MTKKVKIHLAIFSYLAIFITAGFLLLNSVGAQDFGLEAVNNGLGGSLSSADPRMAIGRIIQIALSFLGAIAIIIIMYAGFLWMTSGGDEEKISKAKSILRNAVIGLVIILSAWGITTFILSRLSDALGGGGGGSFTTKNVGLSTSGTAAIGACSVESVYPENNQKDVPRNTSVMITFKEELKLDSICVNGQGTACACNQTDCNKANPLAIRLYKTALGDSCAVSSCPEPNSNVTEILVTATGGNKTLILTPLDFLGAADGQTAYTVKFTDQVKKTDGSSMFGGCGVAATQWEFTVSSSLDLTPPLVAPAGIFPVPDNVKDLYREITPATSAVGAITVNAAPQVYAPAEVMSIVAVTPGTPAGAEVVLDYHGAITEFTIAVPDGAADKAQLFDNESNLLGLIDFDSANQAIFKNYFTFRSTEHTPGNLWRITIKPEQLADILTVNDTVYTFATSAENNNIQVPSNYNNNNLAFNITAKLSGREDIEVFKEGNNVNLIARVAGQNGNNILVSATNNTALTLKAMSGGTDRQETSQARDQKDRPMNSVIQVNFNEPINPAMVSGLAGEVVDRVRVINADPDSTAAGTICSNDADCRSYKCEEGFCVGDYLGGKFVVSNAYKTLEFISDVKCGVNGCGEEIYCLPANSHLVMEMVPANLKTCVSDNDCLAFVPFKTCATTPLGYQTCQNPDGRNYPTANLGNLDGIVDAAVNSFDGDRSSFSDGPLDFYDDNYDPTVNVGKKDKYKWSFYINDQIMLNPPQITAISPSSGQNGLSLAEPIKITFNALMMNSTLRSGSSLVKSGTSTAEHKLINLRSVSPTPLGYWITSDNQDVAPFDGEPDISVVTIAHSPFAESISYQAQIGSGVKDIYQNCYKPSVGPGCAATDESPSCCFGVPTASLGAGGSCQ